MKRTRNLIQNLFNFGMLLGCFFLITGGCVQGGTAKTHEGDSRGGDASQNILTGGFLNLTPNISPNIQFEMKDSLKDLVDLPLGDSAIDAAIKAAGDYLTGGSKPISDAAIKGVEAATAVKPDLTRKQQERIKNTLVAGLKKDPKNQGK